MEKQLRIGDLVVATREIRELDEMCDTVHARPGDMGVVVALIDDGFPTVRFSKTVTDCVIEELELMRVSNIAIGVPAYA